MLGLTEKSGDIMRTVDKLDKIGPDKVRVILVEDIGLSEQDADEIIRFIAIRGTNAEVLKRLEAYRGRDEAFDTGLDELTTVTKYLAAFGVPRESYLAVDLTMAAAAAAPAPRIERASRPSSRSARSAQAAAMTIWRSITPTAACPASA